jgi:hypothetical protein
MTSGYHHHKSGWRRVARKFSFRYSLFIHYDTNYYRLQTLRATLPFDNTNMCRERRRRVATCTTTHQARDVSHLEPQVCFSSRFSLFISLTIIVYIFYAPPYLSTTWICGIYRNVHPLRRVIRDGHFVSFSKLFLTFLNASFLFQDD